MSISYRLMAPHELDATLVDAWREIQSRNDVFASPYFCPEFTRLVADVRDDVRVVVIEDAGRPIGFFPHQRSFLGMGKPVGGPLSDYHGVIAESGSEWNLKELMRAARLSVWTFDHLAGGAHQFEPYITAQAESPQIDLSAGYARYVQGRREAGSDYIPNTEGLARKLARECGGLSFTLHDPNPDTLDRLIRWKSEQYQRTGIVDVFRVSWTRELLKRISQIQTDEFAGLCSALRVDDRIVSVQMSLRSRYVLHYWFPAYDPKFARFSAGIILLLRMAEALAGTGVRSIDLGKGDAQYKNRLMTGAIELREGVVELPSLLASARQLERVAEAHAARGGMAAALRLPLKVIRRIERTRKFR